MDIILPHSLLAQYLKTNATPTQIAKCLSLCGPTVDKLDKLDDDWIYHIEIITNRVDAASAFGIAREAVAILPEFGYEAKLANDPYALQISDLGKLPDNSPVKVKITDDSLVPHFACVALSHTKVASSPKASQHWLLQSGQRPLNNLIDITNELTLKYGQPVHIFDLDKIKKKTMIVRESRAGETIQTLDKRTHTLRGGDIVIEDGEGRLIDLCGIMGGELSAVDNHTTNVLLFVQTYDPKRIRKTSLYTQERTLASQLFEKKPDPEMVLPVLIEGASLIKNRAQAVLSSSVFDHYPKPTKIKNVSLPLTWLDQFSGTHLEKPHVFRILNALGFKVTESDNKTLDCTVPSWRIHDISIKEDLAEEIMRVYGYFRLPSSLPASITPDSATDPLLWWEQKVRDYLAHLGLTEIYNYSLISEKIAQKYNQKLDTAFKLKNPLSEDYVYMRQSLLPSLLEVLKQNQGIIIPPLQIFELSNIYLPAKELAHEQSTLSMLFSGVSFQKVKGLVEALFTFLHVPLSVDPTKTAPPLFIAHKTGVLRNHQEYGYIGHIDNQTIGVEINFEALVEAASPIHHFSKIPSTFPIIEDLTFTLPSETPIGPIIEALKQVDPVITTVHFKNQYQQNATFTLTYQYLQKQLSDQDVAPIRKKVVEILAQKFKSLLVGSLT